MIALVHSNHITNVNAYKYNYYGESTQNKITEAPLRISTYIANNKSNI